MKAIAVLTLIFCLSTLNLFSQTDTVVSDSSKMDIIVCGWPEPPSFPGGDEAFRKYLQENIIYPDTAKKYGKQGTVFVYFEIFPDGSIHNVYTKKGVEGAPELDAEAERVIRAMPNWTRVGDPSAGKVIMAVPIRFVLE